MDRALFRVGQVKGIFLCVNLRLTRTSQFMALLQVPADRLVKLLTILQWNVRDGTKLVTSMPEVKTRRIEPRSEKTGLRGFRPGPTQIGLYSYRKRLEA